MLKDVGEWLAIELKCCQPLTYEVSVGTDARRLPLGADHRTRGEVVHRRRVRPADGGAPVEGSGALSPAPLLAAFLLLGPTDGGPIAWLVDEEQAFSESIRTGKPVLVEAWAEWCTACKLMDRQTWSDPAVRREVQRRFVPLRLDFRRHAGQRPEKRCLRGAGPSHRSLLPCPWLPRSLRTANHRVSPASGDAGLPGRTALNTERARLPQGVRGVVDEESRRGLGTAGAHGFRPAASRASAVSMTPTRSGTGLSATS